MALLASSLASRAAAVYVELCKHLAHQIAHQIAHHVRLRRGRLLLLPARLASEREEEALDGLESVMEAATLADGGCSAM